MYLNIGGDFSVKDTTLIGIFDMDNTTVSKKSREFLRQAEKNGEVVSSDDLPKSYVLTSEYGMQRVYLSSLNTSTLEKRMK